MSNSIFLEGDTGDLLELKELAYDSEDLLQELIARHPNLLAGEDEDEAGQRRWLLVSRELEVGDGQRENRWSLDHPSSTRTRSRPWSR